MIAMSVMSVMPLMTVMFWYSNDYDIHAGLYEWCLWRPWYNVVVHWRSVHPRTDHATFRPKLSVHLTNHLLWQFAPVTFRLRVDGLSIHPKLWHSNLVNLDGLSHCDKPSYCNILSQSLWHFVCVFFVKLCCDILSQRNKRSIFPKNSPISAHFPVWQLILKGPCMNLLYKAQLCWDME
jgi:hypothetical protein